MKWSRMPVPLLMLSAMLVSCGGGGGSDAGGVGGGGSAGGVSVTITDLRVTAQTQTSTELAWTASGASQYRVLRVWNSAQNTGGPELLAVTTATNYRDTTVLAKEFYLYQVLACKSTTEADSACTPSGMVSPYTALVSTFGSLYAPQAASTTASALAADLGLTKVGARWVFADAADATRQTLLDYTVREIVGSRVRLTLTELSYADPLSTVGEIALDDRAGVYAADLTSGSASKVFPYLPAYDFGAVEPLFLTATPAVGQSWRLPSVTSTSCEALDGRAASCIQNVLVTTRIVAHTDTFASLCPHSPLASTLPALKPYKVEQTYEFQAQRPDVFKSEPGYVKSTWLVAGYGFVAARRAASGTGVMPKLGNGNYCLIAANGQ